MICAYLGYNILAIQHFVGTASAMKKMSRKNTPVIESTHCINKSVLCSGHNDISDIIEVVLNSLGRQIKVSAVPVL